MILVAGAALHTRDLRGGTRLGFTPLVSERGRSISRRRFLGGAALCLAQPAFAGAPAQSLRPEGRPGGGKAVISTRAIAAPPAAALIEEARLGGTLGYLVVDGATGQVLESENADTALPPASVAKTFTALYALDQLGPQHRFETRLVATGPVREGEIRGDLILLGGGDPVLDTDGLADLAAALSERGVRRISGRFLVHGGGLPLVATIDPDQPVHVGYSPAVAGLNLNHNRVHFEWARAGGEYQITMEARTNHHRPAVRVARMAIADRDGPLYTYDLRAGREEWSVMRGALGKGGSRWLPVRQPDLYAGDVFRTLALGSGVVLPQPERAGAMPAGTVLAGHQSPPLVSILRDMLRYSTNLTAEAVGMSATLAGGHVPRDLADSGRQMATWAQGALGVNDVRFADHSGLGNASRVTARDMVRMLGQPASRAALTQILRIFPLRGLPEAIRPAESVTVLAKTGTLNFVSGLAGYVTVTGREDLVFAIFAADMRRRDALSMADRERPPGGRAWVGRARVLESRLIGRWATLYRA